jgi:hypothetical protein
LTWRWDHSVRFTDLIQRRYLQQQMASTTQRTAEKIHQTRARHDHIGEVLGFELKV